MKPQGRRKKSASGTSTRAREGAGASPPAEPAVPTLVPISRREVVAAICERMREGQSLREVLRGSGPVPFPGRSAFHRWIAKDPELLAEYTQARDVLMDCYAEELVELGECARREAVANPLGASGIVAAYRLRSDNMKWVMSKLAPKKYGDRLDVTSGAKPLGPTVRLHIFGQAIDL